MGKTQQEPLIAVRLCDSTSIVWCHQVRRDTCNDACLPRAACAWQGEWGREAEGKRALDEKGAGWLVGVLRCARIGYRGVCVCGTGRALYLGQGWDRKPQAIPISNCKNWSVVQQAGLARKKRGSARRQLVQRER